MRVLITGGAASGKSALAEEYCTRLGGRKLYIATMRPWDEESRERVKKHCAQRAGLAFDTLECYQDLAAVRLSVRYDAVLLECLGNLAANEMFDTGASGEVAAGRILDGVDALSGQAGNVVAVTNEVFSGAERYAGRMWEYLEALGAVNRGMAERFDVVVRSVCGLPLFYKGEGLMI